MVCKVASNTWGSIIMVHWPSFFIVSFPGFCTSVVPFFFDGLVQYLSNTPSAIHLDFDLCTAAAKTPLSAIDWYSFEDSVADCLSRTVGRGLLSFTRPGRPSSMTRGVDGRRGGVEAIFLFILLEGVGLLGVALGGVGLGGGRTGEEAILFAADSRRSR